MSETAPTIYEKCYPETAFGGFSNVDGTIAFYTRIQSLLTPDAIALELGCGRGLHEDDPCDYRRNLRVLKGRCKKVIGIDVDQGAGTNRFIDEFRLIEDTSHWPVEDGSIHLIACDYVLEHVVDPAAFFREVDRVLGPGGYLCLRTPNAWSYIAIASRLIPNRLHTRVLNVAQKGRQERDVFPTVYRCNSRRRIRRALAQQHMKAVVCLVEAEPAYFTFSRLAFRMATFWHRYMPATFRSTLLVYAQK